MASTRQSTITPPPVAEPGTVIGPGIQVHGKISGEEDLRVHGQVEGAIHLNETLFVAAEGVVLAEVRARDVVVSGILIGNVFAEDSITLEPGARVVGDLTAPRVIIASGASLRGRLAMGGAAAPPPRARERKVPAKTKAPPSRGRPAAAPRSARPETPEAPAPRSARSSYVPEPAPDLQDDETQVVGVAEPEAGTFEDEVFTGYSKKKTKKVPRVPKPGRRKVARRT